MNYVQPIRSKEKIEQMKDELKKNRYKRLFTICIWDKCRIKNIRYYKTKSSRCFEF